MASHCPDGVGSAAAGSSGACATRSRRTVGSRATHWPPHPPTASYVGGRAAAAARRGIGMLVTGLAVPSVSQRAKKTPKGAPTYCNCRTVTTKLSKVAPRLSAAPHTLSTHHDKVVQACKTFLVQKPLGSRKR